MGYGARKFCHFFRVGSLVLALLPTAGRAAPLAAISGSVSETARGTFLSGATVAAVQGGVVKGQVSTDANGQYLLSGLAAGTYTVSATKPGFSSGTSSVSLRAGKMATLALSLNDVQAPSAPNLLVDLITQTSARLVWDPSSDNTGIYRYYIRSGGGALRDVLSGCYLEDTLTGLTPAMNYSFYVLAEDFGGNTSLPSASVTFTTLPVDTTPPSVPSGLVSTPSPGQVRLDWEPSTDQVGVSAYRVYRDGVLFRAVAATAAPCAVDSDSPDPKAYYRYEVSALDVAGNESARSAPTWGRAGPISAWILSVSPQDGATLMTDRVSVTGAVSTSAVEVLVNGEPARLLGGTYGRDVVNLNSGLNIIEVQARYEGGQASVVTVRVTRAGDIVPVTLSASTVSGTPPLTVQFTATAALPQIAKYQWDLDGDGTFEAESAGAQVRNQTYQAAGRYQARVRVLDTAGLAYGAVAEVQVNLPPVASTTIAAQAGSGLAADAAGNLYAADVGGRIVVYDASGNKTRELLTSGSGSVLSGVALQADGAVFAVDRGTRQVRMFDAQGSLIASFGEESLVAPVDLAVDEGGSIFVTDESSGVVQVFEANGEHLGVLSGSISGDGALSSPKGICAVDGLLYVADSGHNRVAVFSTAGAYLRTVGSSGAGEGELISPNDVAWDRQYEQLLVADAGNSRIVAFDEEGQYALTVTAAAIGASGALGVAPWGDDAGRAIAVADASKITRARLPAPSPEVVWNQMKAALAARDIETAVTCFDPAVQDEYRKIFYILKDQLPQIAADMGTIQHDYTWPTLSRYSIRKTEVFEGQSLEVRHTIHFVKDERGQWKIQAF